MPGHPSSRVWNVTGGAHHKPHLYDQVTAVRADRGMADIWANREAGGVNAHNEVGDMLVNLAWANRYRREVRLHIAFEQAAAAIANLQIYRGHLIDQEITRVQPERPDSQARACWTSHPVGGAWLRGRCGGIKARTMC